LTSVWRKNRRKNLSKQLFVFYNNYFISPENQAQIVDKNYNFTAQKKATNRCLLPFRRLEYKSEGFTDLPF